MEINPEQLLVNAIKDGIREGVKSRLTTGYQNPFEKLILDVISKYDGDLRTLISEGMTSAIGDEKFREELKASIRSILAKTLVQRFGGELEKQVNTLKSDPTTRARITLAIEDILKSNI